MAPTEETLDAAIRTHRQEIIDLLQREDPLRAALSLEAQGWSREWACKAVESIEIKHNPAKLVHGAIINRQLREKHQMRVSLGGGMFVLGLLVSIGTLVSAMHSGGWIVVAYGAVFAGAGMWLKSFPELKKYPDRRLPVYLPPKDPRSHRPADF